MASSWLPPIKRALSGAYVTPWRDKTRAFLMIAIMPGLFGAGLQSMAMNYHMAGEGLWVTTLFQIFRMSLLGFIGIQGTYWLLARAHARIWIGLLQFMGMALFLYDTSSALTNGLAFVLTAGPFWALYSQRNAMALSHDNHGNETALLTFFLAIIPSAGVFVGGLLLDLSMYKASMILAGLCMALSTQAFVVKMSIENLTKKAQSFLGWHKPTTRLTLMMAALFALMDFGMPTWMREIGITPLATGIMLALMPLISLILTPIVGWLIQKGGLGASRAGGLFLCAGWLVLLGATRYHELLLPALVFLKIGMGLVGAVELNRWFKRRSTACIIAREWILATGRIPSAALIMPAIFLMPPLFPIIGAGLSAWVFFGSKKKQKKLF